MNRIFHARIAIGQYLFLVLTTIIVIYAMWMQHAVMAVLFMLLLVIAIERLIHTTYTLTTDDRLLLFLWTLFPFGGNIPERHYLCGAGLVHENRTFRRDALCAGEVRNEGEMCRAASGEGRYVHKNPYESFK